MGIYLFLFLVIFVFSLRGIGKVWLLLLLFALAIVLGFRDEQVGEDTYNYLSYYKSFSIGIINGHMEKGFNFIAMICKIFNLSEYGFHFVVALLTLIPYYFLANTYCDKKINGYVLFLLYSLGFYLLMFNGVRQLLAMSIILGAYYNLGHRKKTKFVLLVLLASTIHTASLCTLPMLFVESIRFTQKKVLWILCASFVLGLLLGESFFQAIAGKYAADIERFGFRIGIMYTLTIGLLTNLLVLWLYRIENSLSNNFWVRYNIISVVVLNVMSSLVIGPRVVYFYSICSVFSLALYLRYTKNKLVPVVVYLYAIITFFRYLLPEYINYDIDGSLVPYYYNFQLFAQ